SVSWEEAEAGQRWTDKLAAFLGLARRPVNTGEPRRTSLEKFLGDPAAREIPGIVVGTWEEVGMGSSSAKSPVEALVAARAQLPPLRAIFLGDITAEESEISWIEQCDVSPLLHAYPALEEFCVRGGQGLSFGALRHEHLRSLVVQTGGLSRNV